MPTHLFEPERYEEVFDEADENKDGLISLDDLRKVTRKYDFNGPFSQLKRCFQEANGRGDNKLTYEEFMLAMGLTPRIREAPITKTEVSEEEAAKQRADQVKLQVLRQIFVAFDQDGNGVIDRTELKQVFDELGKKYNAAQVQRMIDMVDQDGTGTLNYEEFLQALQAKHLVKDETDGPQENGNKAGFF